VNKHLKKLQQHSFGALVNYDEGFERSDDHEQTLGSALWRYVGHSRCVCSGASVLTTHMRAGISLANGLYLMSTCYCWLPTAAARSRSSTSCRLWMYTLVSSPGAPRLASRAQVRTVAAVSRRACSSSGSLCRLIADRAQRQQRVMEGEWRQAISEGGEVYYWHTKTRETSWTKPDAMVEQEARREADVSRWEAMNHGTVSKASEGDSGGDTKPV